MKKWAALISDTGIILSPVLPCRGKKNKDLSAYGGKRHKRYLKEHKRAVYITLLTSGRLNSYLVDIEEQAQERFERIVEQMKEKQGVTEQLKAKNQMEWVARMNNIQACAREIVDKEIIYL